MKAGFLKKENLIALGLTIILCLAACAGKDRTDYGEPITGGPGVYVAGGMDYAALWKDGKVQRLGRGGVQSQAHSVFVDGDTVYVAGMEGEKAVLWDNGKAQILPNQPNAYPGQRYEAMSVFVSKGKVYAAGYTWNQKGVPVATLWVNGEAQYLGEGAISTDAYSVFVDGDDVYVAGKTYSDALLWTNGVAQRLAAPGGGTFGVGYSVYVSNGDVYVAGANWVGISRALLWKNGGVAEVIGKHGTSSYADTVFVSNDDVYVVISQGAAVSWIWKNGEEFSLGDDNDIEPRATGVFVSKGNVYAAGYRNGLEPVLWINGIARSLAPDGFPRSIPTSVFVVEAESGTE
jgi:hypothetical protein